MTRKQEVFIREYLVDLNATQAAIRAGYSPRTAGKIGDENLRKPEISREIERAMAERAERTEITADRVLKELGRIAFFDIRKAFAPDGSLLPLDRLDDQTAAAIAGLEVSEITNPDGVPVGSMKKIKLADKLQALTLLMRHLGMLNDKVTLRGDAENPLLLLIKQVQGTSIRPVPTRMLPRPDNDDDDEDAA